MLRDNIKLNLNEAVKNKDRKVTSTLRLVLAALKDRDIAARSKGNNDGINDDEIKLLLQTMIKQRSESANLYKDAGRMELYNSEVKEIEIISLYLPKQMTAEEIELAVKNIISENKASSIKEMGLIMSKLKEKYSGQCDFSIASKTVRQILTSK